MKFLAIKHLTVEGLGIYAQLCEKAGIEVDIVELEKGDSFPDLEGYSALWVMGGSMNVGDEIEYPWLIAEKALIRKAVLDLHLPYMGICLGAQLLAVALGGRVGAMSLPEVGLLPVSLIDNDYPLIAGLPNTFNVLQWHGQEVQQLPSDSILLASSEACQVQAFMYDDRAFGLQFHNEVTESTVEDWANIPEYQQDLEAVLGINGCNELKQAIKEQLPTINSNAKVIFSNFLQVVKQNSLKTVAV